MLTGAISPADLETEMLEEKEAIFKERDERIQELEEDLEAQLVSLGNEEGNEAELKAVEKQQKKIKSYN